MRRAIGLAAVALAAIALTAAKAPVREPVLRTTSVTLPDDAASYPAGPQVGSVNQNCVACHSASMVTTQPPLSRDQWAAEVAKMRTVYKAPIDDAEVPAILEYLTALSAGTSKGLARAQDPAAH